MNNSRPAPSVGQLLYSLNTLSRRAEGEGVSPVRVTKVGRKYFTTQPDGSSLEREYHIDGWREKTEHTPMTRLYASKQEYSDEQEAIALRGRIYQVFCNGIGASQIPLESLREIVKLLPPKP